MNWSRYILFIIFFSVLSYGIGQSSVTLDKKSRKAIQKALTLQNQKKYEDALKLYTKVLDSYPHLNNIRQQVASIYLDKKNYNAAINELLIIDEHLVEMNPSIILTLADLYEHNSEYNRALEQLKRLENFEFKDKHVQSQYIQRMAEVEFRAYAYNNPVPFEPIPMGAEINTEQSEYLPSFNADGSILVYTKRKSSKRGFGQQEDLYISYKGKDNSFTQGVPISDLNTSQNEGAHTFSQDGKVIIFTACDRRDSYGGCDLYISFFKNGRWGKAYNMGPNINSRFWESQPVLSADNKKLFFSSTRPGGFGKSDIWMVNLESTGWSEAKNLGHIINTPENEGSPFFHPDNRSLYFRSDGHIGLGDFDLFLTRFNGGEWSSPENLGYPINSNKSEGALFVELNGSRAYYTSDQHTDGQHLDILYFELPEHLRPYPTGYIKIKAIDEETEKAVMAKLNLIDLSDNQTFLDKDLDANGEALSTIILGDYALHLSHPDYIFHSEHILLDTLQKDKAFEFLIKMKRLPKEDIVEEKLNEIILKNIFFQTGSSELLKTSDFEIQTLYKLLESQNTMKIKITGHTDNVGREDDNQLLSEQRAKAVYDALISKGIATERLSFEGKGESDPIANNDTEEGRSLNRRTTFTVLPE